MPFLAWSKAQCHLVLNRSRRSRSVLLYHALSFESCFSARSSSFLFVGSDFGLKDSELSRLGLVFLACRPAALNGSRLVKPGSPNLRLLMYHISSSFWTPCIPEWSVGVDALLWLPSSSVLSLLLFSTSESRLAELRATLSVISASGALWLFDWSLPLDLSL